MTKGSPFKLMLLFSIPLLIGNEFQQFYSMVDTIVVGRFVGINALAAVGATSGFSFMVLGFSQGLTMGFSVIVSQRYGAGDYDTMRKAYAMSIICSLISSLVVSLLFAFLSLPLLRLIQTPGNIIGDANLYIITIYIGLAAPIYYNLFSSILRAVGDSKSPLIFLLISSVLNIVLDLFFVIVVPFGVFGVAFATIISQIISALLCYFYIKKKYPMFRLSRSDMAIDHALCKRLFAIGLPGALQFSVCAIGVIIVQAAINSFGSNVVAAYSVGTKIENVITVVFSVLGMAISTFAGQNLGAGDFKRIRHGFNVAFWMMVGATVLTMVLAYFITEPMAYLFVDRNTTDPEIIENCIFYVRTISKFFLFLGLIFIYRTGCQGLGSGMIPMVSSISELVARVIAAFTLPGILGYLGVVLASPIAWVAAGMICPICYFHYIRKIEKRFTLRREEKIAKKTVDTYI